MRISFVGGVARRIKARGIFKMVVVVVDAADAAVEDACRTGPLLSWAIWNSKKKRGKPTFPFHRAHVWGPRESRAEEILIFMVYHKFIHEVFLGGRRRSVCSELLLSVWRPFAFAEDKKASLTSDFFMTLGPPSTAVTSKSPFCELTVVSRERFILMDLLFVCFFNDRYSYLIYYLICAEHILITSSVYFRQNNVLIRVV